MVKESGILYIVATPIGNLQDITLRAIETLKKVAVIACEDTRRTQKLLNHFEISKRTIRYDEHSHNKASENIIELLEKGNSVALVSNAGTPAISDPGSRLVSQVYESGFRVIPIPGASVVVSGL
jgi:16S rRNA (cytidine1402-2'-O)-methyltransferase